MLVDGQRKHSIIFSHKALTQASCFRWFSDDKASLKQKLLISLLYQCECVWCGWLVPVVWLQLKLGLKSSSPPPPPPSFRCLFFSLSHRKGEIKVRLENTGSPVITHSPLSVSPSFSISLSWLFISLFTSFPFFVAIPSFSLPFPFSVPLSIQSLVTFSVFSPLPRSVRLPPSPAGSLMSIQGLPVWNGGWEEERLDERRG